MSIIEGLIGPVAKLIDKIIPDPEARDRLGDAPAGRAAAVGGVVYIAAFAVDDGFDQRIGVEIGAVRSGHDSRLRLVDSVTMNHMGVF